MTLHTLEHAWHRPRTDRQPGRRRPRLHAMILFGLIAGLGGCHSSPAQDKQISTQTATPYVGPSGHQFQYLAASSRGASKQDVQRLMRTLDAAYELLDFQAPYPKIKIVDRRGKDKMILANAYIGKDGSETIAISRRQLHASKPLLPLLVHELAHLQAWRRYGTVIAVHGLEFQQICRSAVSIEACAATG